MSSSATMQEHVRQDEEFGLRGVDKPGKPRQAIRGGPAKFYRLTVVSDPG